MTDWTLTRDETTAETDLFNIQTTKSANPFGDFCIAKIDDFEGTHFDEYPFGTRVDAEVSENGSTYQDFTGFVVERRETDQQGADILEVESYTFDQFLRNNDVTNDQSGNTISAALEDIVKTDTPVTWNAANVEVVDDVELSLSLKDERVETALQMLSFKSGNEGFGVNDSLEFFFRPRETTHIDRGIDNTQWFDYDLPERGKEAINEVEVRFNGGNDSVVVDNPGQKLDLQEGLNLPDPGTQRARINRPEITDPKDAEDEARRYLKFKNATLSGTVTTYGLLDADPFDTIGVEITDRGIDDEFIITAIEKKWGRDETILTLVENRGFDADFIVRLAEKTERLDLRDSDPDAKVDRITTTNLAANLEVTGDLAGTTTDRSRFVNDGRNQVRDGWKGDGNLNIADVAVGTNNSGLSRSNSSLVSQVATATASETLVGDTSVDYSATFTQSGVEEVGLLDASGNLVCRATPETPVDLNSDTVTVTVDVTNDASVDRGVVTNAGQEAIRDVIADNSPTLPADYAYGSGTTAPAVTDTSLENQTYVTGLDEVLLKTADTTTQWQDIVPDFADDVPLKVEDGYLQHKPVTRLSEAENTTSVGTEVTSTDTIDWLSNSEGVYLEIAEDIVQLTFSFEHDIPADEAYVGIHATLDNFDGEVEYRLDGEPIEFGGFSYSGVTEAHFTSTAPIGKKLKAGTDYTFEARLIEDNNSTLYEGVIVDVIFVFDWGRRFTGGTGGWDLHQDDVNDGMAAFDGPSLYPNLQEVNLNTIDTRRTITKANINSSWYPSRWGDTVTNDQFISLSNNGTDYITTNNSETASANFASAETGLDVRVGLSHMDTEQSGDTPVKGMYGQQIDLLEAYANVDAIVSDGIGEVNSRAILPERTLTVGDTLTESGQLNANGTTLTRSVFADVDIDDQIRNLISSETLTFRTT